MSGPADITGPDDITGLTGTGDGEVLRALLRRRDGGSRPGARADGCRIALVVSGGGMRGAYAGGMAHALADAGLATAFDVVYGSSAGAYIGAALLTGHGEGAARIFHENMASRAFIDPRRAGRRRPVVSLDHLLDTVMDGPKPMPWAELIASPTPLRVIATAADDLTPHALDGLATVADWKLAMRATAAIPFLAGPPVELHGRRWIDGSVAEPLPVLRALRDGATHVLALLTRTVPELRRADPGPGPARLARLLDHLAPGLGTLTRDVERHAPVLAVLEDAAHPDRRGSHLRLVAPAHNLGVRGLTTDPVLIRRAADAGYETLMTALREVQDAVPG